MAARDPRQAAPKIWGPQQSTWPEKVGVVSYGSNANYVGPLDLWDYTAAQMMSVGGPEDLAQWAAKHNVRFQT